MAVKRKKTVYVSSIAHPVNLDDHKLYETDWPGMSERLAENTVAWMDDQMQTFNVSRNALNDNMLWAERTPRIGELTSYDADYHMRSPAHVPADSPDKAPPDITDQKVSHVSEHKV